MNISLIVCAHNEEKWIGACLTHALKNKIPELSEIIVVNNASTDKTEEIALSFSSDFPGLRVVKENEKGLTKARARGLKEATGDILAYIDADTQMPLGWLQKVKKTFTANSKLAAVSGPYQYYDLSSWQEFMNNVYWTCLAYPTYFFTGYMMVGGNFAVKREALLKIGGFDESIDFYGEDTDIARRLSYVGKVKFTLFLPMPTSARRLKKEGLLTATFIYAANFFSEVLRKKPFTREYKDIRE
ncbi:MAG TPA: glycosyltransferase family A protein [Candidatus Paceibacterota bacterium]